MFTNEECQAALNQGDYIHAQTPVGGFVLYRIGDHPFIPDVLYLNNFQNTSWSASFRFANAMASTADVIIDILNEGEALLLFAGDGL